MNSSSRKDESDEDETLGDEDELNYPEEDYTYIPIYAVPNAVTEALVGESPAPGEYKEDKDIGSKAVKDDWQEYISSQDRLKYLILALLALMLAIPILGLYCCGFCGRCRRRARYCPIMRCCCSAFLVLSALAMLLSLIFAIMATVQLNKSLRSTEDCHSQSFGGGLSSDKDVFGIYSEYRRHRLHGTNYNQLSNATRTVIRAEAMRNLSEVLRNMQGAKPLLEELRDELPVAKDLAIRFRDALSAIKQNLKVFLTSQCSQGKCGDFYRDNEIGMLDEGCLHYDRVSFLSRPIKRN
ncbi:hypothetical protein KR032_004184 [Drosophila birchii]|nr:hypothetical protein KR032_004184 [Drosophila birchii]